MKRVYLVIIFLVFLLSNTIAQIRELNVGEAVPEMKFDDVFYHNTKNINLQDLLGKLVIFDFWGRNCSECIAAMPKMDSIQKRYGSKIKILPVISTRSALSPKSVKFIDSMWHANKYLASTSLPNILDTVLYKYFPHQGVPFLVWVGADGKFLGRTSTAHVTVEEIDNILNGKLPDWEMSYNYPLHENVSAALQRLRYADSIRSDVSYPGIFSKPIRGVYPWFVPNVYSDSLPGSKIFRVVNKPIKVVLETIYDSEFDQYKGGSKFTIVITKDSAKYFNMTKKPTVEWVNSDGFCYNLMVPKTTSEKQAHKIIVQDMERHFGFHAGIEESEVNCYTIKKKSGTRPALVNDDKMRHLSIKDFTLGMNTDSDVKEPFVFDRDCQDIILQLDYNVDYANNLDLVKKHLNQNGLDLVKGKRKMKMLVIRDN